MDMVSFVVAVMGAIFICAGFAVGLFIWRDELRFARPARSECECRERVPVHISTGQHVASLCPECGRHVYKASWVYRGK